MRFPNAARSAGLWIVLFSVVALSGCAIAGVAINWGGLGAAVLAGLALIGCGIPAVTDQANPKSSVATSARSVDLTAIIGGDGTKGFVIRGAYTGERLGASVSMGDLNGDGLADLAVGAPHYYTGYPGGVHVLLGHAPPISPDVYSYDIRFGLGKTFKAPYANSQAGFAVAFVGDVTGDGLEDLAIGMPNPGVAGGSVALVFGNAVQTGLSTLSAPFLNAVYGIRIGAEGNGSDIGRAIAFTGDLDGDGVDDLAIGMPNYTNAGFRVGRVQEILGRTTATPFTSYADLINPYANSNNILTGSTGAERLLGFALAGGGNVDGDGLGQNDLLIGAPGMVPPRAIVHFNPAAGGAGGSFPNGPFATFQFYMDSPSAGGALAMGDLNGDGHADLIIAAPYANRVVSAPTADDLYSGRVYVVFGSPVLVGAVLSTSSLDGTNGFTIVGPGPNAIAGFSVAMVGDVNGDGYPDLAIASAVDTSTGYEGLVYIVFGGPGPFPSELQLSQLTTSQGMILAGVPNAQKMVVGGGRDMDGDGQPDLVIGMPYAGYGNGSAIVIFNKALK